MLLFALALSISSLQQDSTQANVNDAALQCANVSAREIGEEPTSQFRALSHYMHFASLAAIADPGSEAFLQRVAKKGEEAGKLDPAKNTLVRAACEARFPQVYRPAPAPVATDSFEQNTLCLINISMLFGLISETPGFAGAESIKTAMERYGASVTEADLTARGLTDEAAFLSYASDLLKDKLATDSMEGIALSCGVSPY